MASFLGSDGWLMFVSGGLHSLMKKFMKTPPLKTETAQTLQVPSTEIGANIPVVFGTVLIKDPKIAWWGDLLIKKEEITDSAGKKG